MRDAERIKILEDVSLYYARSFSSYGATAKGVDWNGDESQECRFEQLAAMFPHSGEFSVNDLGCGYGAFHRFLLGRYPRHQYHGYDLVPEMISWAQQTYQMSDSRFDRASRIGGVADYSVASGIFNVKGDVPGDEWLEYVRETLTHMRAFSSKGFAFNLLTSASDPERRKPNLYYANPAEVMSFCLENFSRTVTLRHGYALFEFTILVDLEGIPPR